MASVRKALMISVNRLLKSTTTTSGRSFVAPLRAEALISPKYAYSWDCHSYLRAYCSIAHLDDIDLSNEDSKRRLFNRLIYRSKQRGFLELDLVLGKWVEDNIHSMDENGIKSLSQVLDLENPDLWKWLIGQEQPPKGVEINPVFMAVHEKITNNLDRHAAPETRATPGQPWVRGWDDFKKGKDSPITGNQ